MLIALRERAREEEYTSANERALVLLATTGEILLISDPPCPAEVYCYCCSTEGDRIVGSRARGQKDNWMQRLEASEAQLIVVFISDGIL